MLKKVIIGNLTNSEMAKVIGGDAYGTGAGMCTNFTKHKDTHCQSDYQGNYGGHSHHMDVRRVTHVHHTSHRQVLLAIGERLIMVNANFF